MSTHHPFTYLSFCYTLLSLHLHRSDGAKEITFYINEIDRSGEEWVIPSTPPHKKIIIRSPANPADNLYHGCSLYPIIEPEGEGFLLLHKVGDLSDGGIVFDEEEEAQERLLQHVELPYIIESHRFANILRCEPVALYSHKRDAAPVSYGAITTQSFSTMEDEGIFTIRQEEGWAKSSVEATSSCVLSSTWGKYIIKAKEDRKDDEDQFEYDFPRSFFASEKDVQVFERWEPLLGPIAQTIDQWVNSGLDYIQPGHIPFATPLIQQSESKEIKIDFFFTGGLTSTVAVTTSKREFTEHINKRIQAGKSRAIKEAKKKKKRLLIYILDAMLQCETHHWKSSDEINDLKQHHQGLNTDKLDPQNFIIDPKTQRRFIRKISQKYFTTPTDWTPPEVVGQRVGDAGHDGGGAIALFSHGILAHLSFELPTFMSDLLKPATDLLPTFISDLLPPTEDPKPRREGDRGSKKSVAKAGSKSRRALWLTLLAIVVTIALYLYRKRDTKEEEEECEIEEDERSNDNFIEEV